MELNHVFKVDSNQTGEHGCVLLRSSDERSMDLPLGGFLGHVNRIGT
jgi:hypothetical protein